MTKFDGVSGASILETRDTLQGTQAAYLDIRGLILISPRMFGDPRGFFMETWNAERYDSLGVGVQFLQDNLSYSARGVLRGLHFQEPGAQTKLVSVVDGEVFDVVVDVRRGSPTFGRWAGVILNGDNRRQFYIPRGFAHGFCVLSETAYFSYKCDAYYAPAHERTIAWSDPDIGIQWPAIGTPSLSQKDLQGQRLRDFDPDLLPIYAVPTR